MLQQRIDRKQQLNVQPLAGTIVLEDYWIAEFGGSSGNMLNTNGRHGRGRLDLEFGERLVLRHLRHLKLQGAFAIDDRAAMALEPGQHRRGVLRCEAVSPRMRGGAHAIVENAVWRCSREVENAAIEKPLAIRCAELSKFSPERLDPGGILMDHEDRRRRP